MSAGGLPFGVPPPTTPPRVEFDARLRSDPLAARTLELGIPAGGGVELESAQPWSSY